MERLSLLIPKYSALVLSENSNSELYKWEAIQHFQKHWNIEASDFQEMFKNSFSKKQNLIHQIPFGFLNKLAHNMPEQCRALFRDLLNDSVALEKRIIDHQNNSSELLVQLKSNLGNNKLHHQQDERTISFLLTLHNPEKYYLYKENVYKALCSYLKVVPEKRTGQKYFHFVLLSDPLLEEIKNSEEVQKVVKTFIPVDFPFDSTKLLFQDIMYRVLILSVVAEKEREVLFNISEDIKALLEERGHALADHIWYDNDAKHYRQVSMFPEKDIYYMHYEIMRRKNDIAWEFHPEGDIDKKIFLKPFVEGYEQKKYKRVDWKYNIRSVPYVSGTYFKIVPNKKILYSVSVDNYSTMIEQLTNQFEELYADTNDRLIEFLKIHGRESELPELNKKFMNIPLNQILYGPPGTGKTFHTANEALQILGENIDGMERSKMMAKYSELVKTGRIVFTTFHQSLCYEDFVEGLKPLRPESRNESVLYDVIPGIFKSLCTDAMEAIQEFMVANEKFANDPETLTFSEKYKRFINAVKRGTITFITKTGKPVSLTEVTRHGNFRLTTRVASYIISEKRLGKLREVYSSIDQIKNVEDDIRKVIGGCNSSLFYAALQAFIEFEKELANVETELSADFDLFGAQLSEAEINQLPRFVLIIDEINRGNISSIFGELITLLEDDKRFGRENATVVELPYSGEQFIVPPNVYIVGTMNTADRSVEALDTALRRRFSFKEMLPDPDVIARQGINSGIVQIPNSSDTINLKNLLEVINKRIEVLVDRDHTIGHSFFINVKDLNELKVVFQNKIIPLLQEYFYGDYQKMEMVIGSAFFEARDEKPIVFAIKNHDFDATKVVYKLKDLTTMSDTNFKEAIDTLINGQSK